MANLCLITAWFASLFDSDFGYFNKVPVSGKILGALFTNLAVLTLLFWSAGLWVRRIGGRFIVLAANVAMVLIWAIPLDFYRSTISRMPDRIVVGGLKSPLGLTALLLIVMALAFQHQRMARISATVFLVLSPLGLFTVGKSLFVMLGWMHIAQDSTSVHPLATPLSSTNLPRVIWVVFDEFDYRFAFANRPSDLKMPEMDRFAAGSWRATQAFPPGGATIVSIPALLSGKTIRSATPVSERDLRLKLEPGGEHVLWSELPSIFRQARNEGANCGIVGWYHPYGRLFCDSVSWCEWVPLPRFEPARVDSFWGTVERELLAMGNPINQRLIHLRNFKQTLAAGEGLAVNPNCQIAFLHLPVPHKPGIMNGRGQLTAFGVPSSAAYIGNLALADRAFGNIRQTMEKSELWKQSWVVVSSDHFWRVGMGNTEPPDHRIPFIVKAPDAVPKEYDRPFNTVVTGEMVLAVLKRELRSGMQLNDWFDEHAPPPPKAYNETPEGE